MRIFNSEHEAPFVSLVIPAYNEEKRIQKSIMLIQEYLDMQAYRSEIIIVDDGSTDNTSLVARSLLNGNHRILRYKQNMGKGYAVRKGVLDAKGKYIFFMDADLSTPIDELNKFLDVLEQGIDVVIGTRKHKDAKVKRRQPIFREFLGKCFTFIINLLVVKNISDVTCGFKGYKNKVAKDLFYRQRIFNWSYDAELLFLTQKLGYSIKELPVTWYDADGTKVKLHRDIIGSLKGVFQIRFNYLFDRYNLRKNI